MKPAAFDYHAPTTLPEALALLIGDQDAKVLAGGQSLIPMMNMRLARPSALVDLRLIEGLGRRRVGPDGATLGAMTTHRIIETDRAIGGACTILPAAARLISHFQVRERGTVGGSLAHGDPSAEWPMIAVLLDAKLKVASAEGFREVSAREFFVSVFTTALGAGEIITEVHFPALPGRSGWGVREVARRPGDFAILAVSAVTVEMDGRYSAASMALAGAGPIPHLAAAAGRLVGELPSPELWRLVADAVADEIEPEGDLHASVDDRRDITRSLVAKVLTDAHERARGAQEGQA